MMVGLLQALLCGLFGKTTSGGYRAHVGHVNSSRIQFARMSCGGGTFQRFVPVCHVTTVFTESAFGLQPAGGVAVILVHGTVVGFFCGGGHGHDDVIP